jgi:amino acid transporter
MFLQIMTACISIMPIVLFIVGALGYFGVMSIGPRELPKGHPDNKPMSLAIIVAALGLFGIISTTTDLAYIGVTVALIALVFYSIFYMKARKDFPTMPDSQYIAKVKQEQEERIEAIHAKRLAKAEAKKAKRRSEEESEPNDK